MTTPTFEGTPEQQALASEIFTLMVMQGAFFAKDAPIRQTLANLADFLARQRNVERSTIEQTIDAAIQANMQVFVREQQDGDIIYITSREGRYQPRTKGMPHTFRERLYEPENPLPVDDISVVVSTSRPTLTTVEPVFISDYWQEQAGLIPMTPTLEEPADETGEPAGAYDTVEARPLEPEATPPEAAATTPPEESVLPEDGAVWHRPDRSDATPPPEESVLPEEVIASIGSEQTAPPAEEEEAEAPVAATPAYPAAAEETTEELNDELAADMQEAAAQEAPTESSTPAVQPATVQPPRMLTIDETTSIDLSQPVETIFEAHAEPLRHKLLDSLEHDPLRRMVRFGSHLYPESALASLSKNDMRRIRDLIIEAGEPLPDTAIIADLYYQQQSAEVFRFSLNYRLSREKDFEFVGVEGANLWSVRELPAIGTKRLKASEMGQLTSYLVEGYDESLQDTPAENIHESKSVTRVLTFFEWAYGVLELDASMQIILPRPVLPDQRNAVLRIESPQHFTSYLAEVRYPTNNRGGWLHGLDEFFREHLMPGAPITLELTDEPGVLAITYEEVPEGNIDRVLTLDEKKNKFTFSDRDFFCAVDEDLLPSQQRYGRLKNLKVLPTGERRKADMVLQHVFEAVGEQLGSREQPLYRVDLDTLYVAYNVLRPGSRSFLQALLESNEHYSPDDAAPDTYLYTPEREEPDEDEESDEEDESVIPWEYDDE